MGSPQSGCASGSFLCLAPENTSPDQSLREWRVKRELIDAGVNWPRKQVRGWDAYGIRDMAILPW